MIAAALEVPLKKLLAPGVIDAALLVIMIMTIIVVAIWNTDRLSQNGLSPYPSVFRSTNDYGDGLDLEYCSSLSGCTMTWPLSLQLYELTAAE
jgi:hypothetical protein